jgi:hypothetical protein
MAVQKTEALSLGIGALPDHLRSLVVFSSAGNVSSWSSTETYTPDKTVEYSNSIWRCVTSNFNSVPAITNANWQLVYKNVKDGDICLSFDGISSNILQRINGIWEAYKENTITVNLVDGQTTPTPAITFIGNTSYYSKLEYTIKRGSGEVRKRAGSMNILNDGNLGLSYDHEFMEIGNDVNVWITPVINAGTVELQYTSDLENELITFTYLLKKWG